jgi:hypothetical protein
LIEGTVTAKVLSFLKRREKKDRIGESQPFGERNLSLQDKISYGWKSNPWLSAYRADALKNNLCRDYRYVE